HALEKLSQEIHDVEQIVALANDLNRRRLRARRDPPLGMRRPDEAIYQSAISTLELALDQAYPVTASLNTADRVSDAELAVGMAKFIWNAGPDAVLLDAVQRGRLREP